MIVLLLVTGAVYFFLQYLTPLSAPVLLAMLFVTIFGPMMKRMNQRLHFPRPLSAIVLLIVATVLLVGLLWILVSWMLGSLPVWIGNLELRGRDYWCGHCVSGKYGQWQTTGGAGFTGRKYSAGNAFPVYAVCAVVRGAGRISGDVFDRFGAAGERL